MIDINAVSQKKTWIFAYNSIEWKPNKFEFYLDNRKCDEETEFTCDENKSWGRSQCIPKKW